MAIVNATPRTRKRIRSYWLTGWRLVGVIALALAFLFPFLAMISTAFKETADIFTAPPSLLPPTWTLDNFVEAFEKIPFWRYLANTLFISGMAVLGTIIATPLVAYSLAKVKWAGAKPLLILVLMTMMLPPQVTMIPIYIIWNRLDLVGTYAPLIVPAFLGTPFLIFMVRQFLMNVPDEIIEAARIDGANEFRTFRSVVLPIARPAIVTAAIFQFVWTWTDFLNPLIYLTEPEQYTLSIGLYSFFGENDVAWGPLMSASVMFTIPALLIFLIGQRFFIGGISTGALK